MEVQYKILDRIFIFNRELSPVELILPAEDLRELSGYISDSLYVSGLDSIYTLESLTTVTNEYQFDRFDSMALTYLLNAKTQLLLSGLTGTTYALPYQMILSVERWMKKLWGQYDVYKLTLLANNPVNSIDYNTLVGEPPCSFKDIQWVLDPTYQLKEPTRSVNLDISYYTSYEPGL